MDHKKFKIGQMVTVLWRKSWYVGKYYGWAKSGRKHMIRFPFLGDHGVREILFSDGNVFSTKTIAKAKQVKGSIEISYPFGGGVDPIKDRLLEKIVGRKCDGSGYDFMSSRRDLTWMDRTRDSMKKIKEKCKGKEGLRGLKFKFWPYEE